MTSAISGIPAGHLVQTDSGSIRARLSESMVPLVVDLDGTLTLTDTLVESVIQMARKNPLDVLALPFQLMRGRAAMKHFVTSRVLISAELLPYRTALLDYLRTERAKGRRLFLATAADSKIAEAVAAHLGLFDGVIASDGIRNLKGAEKLKAIQTTVGDHFVYAGDSAADIEIWSSAQSAILAAVPGRIEDQLRPGLHIEQRFPAPQFSLKAWLRALRVHQWAKNLLVFTPLLTTFSFLDAHKVLCISAAFVAFCLVASGTYIVNDVSDLENDRAHPRKRNRPFASGQLSLVAGLLVAFALLIGGFAVAAWVSWPFLVTLLAYLVLTSLYNWKLKTYILVDVLTLALLYTLRIIAGAVAIDVRISSWFLEFSIVVFLSLALLKRCAELVTLGQINRESARGRDYNVTDLTVLWPLGVGAAVGAVVVFGLFISTPETQDRYASPQFLWFAAFGMMYWLSRLWIKTARGEMDDDPLVYTVKDFGSQMTILGMVVATLLAHFLSVGSK